MTPYKIRQVYGITYGMRKVLLPLEVDGIFTMPLRKVEEMIFNAIRKASAKDPYVRLEILTSPV